MKYLISIIRKLKLMIQKSKLSFQLKGLNSYENTIVDSLISEGKDESEILSIIKGIRIGIKIEKIKQLLKEYGISENEINDLILLNIKIINSYKSVDEIVKMIKEERNKNSPK